MYQLQQKTLNGWIVSEISDDKVKIEALYHSRRLLMQNVGWRIVKIKVLQCQEPG